MSEISARIVAPNVVDETDRQAPLGLFYGRQGAEPFTLPEAVTLWYDPGTGLTSDLLPAGLQAWLWQGSKAATDAAQLVLLDNLATWYVLFSYPGSLQLYAATQSQYQVLSAVDQVMPLWHLQSRRWRRARPAILVGLVCNDVSLDVSSGIRTLHQGYPVGDGINYSDPGQFGIPPAGWTDIGFDDSAWLPIVFPLAGATTLFRLHFTLPPGYVHSGSFTLTESGGGTNSISLEVYVNGNELANSADPNHASIPPFKGPFNIPLQYFVTGPNVLALRFTYYGARTDFTYNLKIRACNIPIPAPLIANSTPVTNCGTDDLGNHACLLSLVGTVIHVGFIYQVQLVATWDTNIAGTDFSVSLHDEGFAGTFGSSGTTLTLLLDDPRPDESTTISHTYVAQLQGGGVDASSNTVAITWPAST